MKVSRHLVYVSNVVPGPGQGGRIVIDRHLRRLAAEGWSLTVVSPFSERAVPGPWREVCLPARRWWWPPLRATSPWLLSLRSRAWRRELSRAGVPPASAVATICWGSLSWLAADLAVANSCPLIAIVHDWWGETGGAAETLIGRYVCASAKTVLVVSNEMQAAVAAECSGTVDLLYPLPASRTRPWAVWQGRYAKPTVAHVGALHGYHLEYLARVAAALKPLDGRLLLLCPRDNPVAKALRARCPNLVHRDSFAANADALAWIAAEAGALTVMYPNDTSVTGQRATGFPSRLVEFSQLGLPVLLAAPLLNPIRTWATYRNWQGQVAPDDQAGIERWLLNLTLSKSWQRLADDTRAAAETDFDPDHLHARFVFTLRN